MRTTTLTAAALLGLTLLAPTQAATATTERAAETCQGVPATIVGTPVRCAAAREGCGSAEVDEQHVGVGAVAHDRSIL